MKTLFLLILLLLPALVSAEAGEIRIGIIVPLSGDMALHGTEIQQAMELALGEAQKKPLAYSYRLIFEDNALDGAKSTAAAQKLLNIDKVDVVVTLWPPTAHVVIPLTEKAGVLHYTIGWDPSIARDNTFVLNHQVMVDQIVRSTLRLLQSQGKRRIAFLHLQETGFDLGAGYMRSLAPGECEELAVDEAFGPSETDFRSLIVKTLGKKPDAFLIWSVMPSIDILIKQIRTQNPSIPISGYFDYVQDLKQVQNFPYISEMYASPSFADLYEKKYHGPPVSKGANAFDIMNLLIRAYESSKDHRLTAAEMKRFLTGLKNIDGAVGRFSIDKDGNSSYLPVVREIRGSERKLVDIELDRIKSCAP